MTRRARSRRKKITRKGKRRTKIMIHGNKRSYLIHDNGGRPFVVDLSQGRNHVTIFRWKENERERGEKVYESNVTRIWLGDNLLDDPAYVGKGEEVGNTVLLEIGQGEYVFVGGEIYRFITGEDQIRSYFSPLRGGSDVPYPYAIGEHYVYFFLDKKRVSADHVDSSQNGYEQFYRGEIPDSAKKGFRVIRIARASYS